MRTIREILRLHFEHDLSQRAIARACAVFSTTVDEYLERTGRLALIGLHNSAQTGRCRSATEASKTSPGQVA